MRKTTFLKLWSLCVGAMDAMTGLLLIIAPLFTLRLMGITPPSAEATVFLGWIGVFVMSVGLGYGLALVHSSYCAPIWFLTALIRTAVAVFLTIRILDGSLETRWILVGITDASVAIVQCIILRAGWWKEVPA